MSVDFISNYYVNGRTFSRAALSLLLVIFFASPVYAHKVTIFAYADGDLIHTESRFSGGRPARNCDINVLSITGQNVVATGKSDEKGLFSFPVPNPAGDMDIVITCGDGHRGSWRLEAQEYLPSEASPAPHVHPSPVQPSPKINNRDDALLRKIVAEEVDKKLTPLRRDLARLAERKTSLQDILGGIGYILGLAGLAAYMKFKKKK